jgi:hypothetical protein
MNVSSDLAEITAAVDPDTTVRVIVGSDGPLTVTDRTRIHAMLLSWGGEMVDDDFDSYDGYVAECPASKVGDLARDAKSAHVAPDRTVRAAMDVALPTVAGTPGSTTPPGDVLAAYQIRSMKSPAATPAPASPSPSSTPASRPTST